MVLLLVILVVLILAVIFRRQIVWAIHPPANNWVLLGMFGVTVILFFIALRFGNGEPLGTRVLRLASEAHQVSPQVQHYRTMENVELFTNQVRQPPPARQYGSWIWWWIFMGWLTTTIFFVPVAFHDEVGNAWNYAWERWDQRTRRISLRPRVAPHTAPPATATTGTTVTPPATGPTVPEGFLGKLWWGIKHRLPIDLLAEFINDFLGAAGRGIFRR